LSLRVYDDSSGGVRDSKERDLILKELPCSLKELQAVSFLGWLFMKVADIKSDKFLRFLTKLISLIMLWNNNLPMNI